MKKIILASLLLTACGGEHYVIPEPISVGPSQEETAEYNANTAKCEQNDAFACAEAADYAGKFDDYRIHDRLLKKSCMLGNQWGCQQISAGVEEQRNKEAAQRAEVENKRSSAARIFAAGLQGFSNGVNNSRQQNQQNQPVHCTSTRLGNTVSTSCY